jgi:hypothetical protein
MLVFRRCRVCSKIFLFNIDIVHNHVRSSHNLNFGAYKKLYLNENYQPQAESPVGQPPDNKALKKDRVKKKKERKHSPKEDEENLQLANGEELAVKGANLPSQESLEHETRADLVESDISFTLSDNLDESFVSHEIGPLADTVDAPMDAVNTEDSTSIEKCQTAVNNGDLGRCDSPAPAVQNKPDVEDDNVIVTANLNEKCLFVCGVCHKAFTCLRNHVTADHQLSPEEYQALYPNIQYERKTYHR